MPDWTIRPGTSADIDAVLALWEADGGEATVTSTRDGLARLLERDSEALLVAVTGEQLIGSIIAAWDGWRGSFYRLVVRPQRRREGIASALLRAAERRLQDQGAMRLTAIVIDGDAAALGFWSAAGYERQASRARFVRSLRERVS